MIGGPVLLLALPCGAVLVRARESGRFFNSWAFVLVVLRVRQPTVILKYCAVGRRRCRHGHVVMGRCSAHMTAVGSSQSLQPPSTSGWQLAGTLPGA
jgi:hypothetical protein